jgi:hypothetical protein
MSNKPQDAVQVGEEPKLPPMDEIYWQEFGNAPCGASDAAYAAMERCCRERQLKAALKLLQNKVASLKDSAKVHVNILRGEIALTKAQAIHIAGLPADVEDQLAQLTARVGELEMVLNTPETEDFFKGVPLEAAHQRVRWPSEHDASKTPADWFWLVGYLAGKCLASHIAGNTDKALHHTISTAAALANWHCAIKGTGDMRPGIDTPVEADPGYQQREGEGPK